MKRQDADETTGKGKGKKRRPSLRGFWRLVLLAIGIVAVVQELQKPPKERTWVGEVIVHVPYDFRIPTAERMRETYWNPDGPLVASKAFGVGWALNFGAVKRLIGG
ncbi:MAG: hypothetical protein ACLFWM_02040 [Actinomycetota bacterium]